MEKMKAKMFRLRQAQWELERSTGREKRIVRGKIERLVSEIERRRKGVVMRYEIEKRFRWDGGNG